MPTTWKDHTLLHFSMLCIATSGAFARSLSISPTAAIWWRCLLAVGIMLGYCRYRGFSFRVEGHRNRWVVLASGVLMTFHWVAYFYALAWSNVAVAMVAVFTFPAITAILEPLLLKQRFQPIHILLAALVLTGVAIMAPSADLNNDLTAGIAMGIFSATVYAIRNILMKTQVNSVQGSVLMTYQVIIAVILLLPLILISGETPLMTDWPALIGLGLITTAIGHTLFLISFRAFSVTTASLIGSTQPVYGIAFGFLLLGEVPGWNTVWGGGLILASVVIEALRAGRYRLITRP